MTTPDILAAVAGLGLGELVLILLVLIVPFALVLLLMPAFRALIGRPATPTAPSQDSTTRLAELRGLLDQGLVTQTEYDARRQQIIDSV